MASQFFNHKQAFFQAPDLAGHTFEYERIHAPTDFVFLSNHRSTIEHEFNELYASLKKLENKAINREYWLFCYQTCYMLKTYYDTYSPEKAAEYSALLTLIERESEGKQSPPSKHLSLVEKIHRDLDYLIKLPFSSLKIRNALGNASAYRLSSRFTLLTLKEMLLIARQFQLLDMLEKILGRHINISILDAPLGIYNALSVGIFAARFVMNSLMLIKHVFFPVELEKALPMVERLYGEVGKRHYHLLNDGIWSTVNGLTNYAHLSSNYAGSLLLGFLVFDGLLLSFELYLLEEEYAIKKREYELYRDPLTQGSTDWIMVNAQIEQLERSTENTRMALRFYIGAAISLFSSFSLALLLAPAVLVPFCYLAGNIAIAMYLSGGAYGVYKEKCLILKQEEKIHSLHVDDARENVQDAWEDLRFIMIKNTVAPFIILGAYTINFPAAVILTLAYMAYESGCDYLSVPSLK